MRLTLRTMLAYLDDILEPADAQELGEKIKESEFASGLVHRIRSSTRRLRLDAPKLEGKGMGLDPNTVSEYLDNTLPQDRVPDFEKVCLESDVHLAEVAACHQVLTLVLGEPADVTPAGRQRIYRLQSPSDPEAPGGGGPGGSGEDRGDGTDPEAGRSNEDSTTSPASDASEPELPPDPADLAIRGSGAGDDRIGGGRSRLRALAATLAFFFLIALVSLIAMGRFDRNHPLLKMFGSSAEVAQTRDTPSGGEQAKPPLEAVAPSPAAPEAARPPDDAGEATGSEPPPSVESGEGSSSGETAGSAQSGRAGEGDEAATSQEGASPDAGGQAGAGDSQPPGSDAAASPESESTAAAGTVAPGPADEGAAADKAAAGLGRYISEEQVLARLDPSDGSWYRLPPRAVLTAEEQFFVLPTYRPQILLASGAQATFVGPTSFQLRVPQEPGDIEVAMQYGQALIVAVGGGQARVRLDLGGRRGVAAFPDAESSMAVEVRRYLPPGSDPELVPPQRIVRLFTTSGRVDWREEGAETTVINAGDVCAMVDDQPAMVAAAGKLPVWLDPKSLSDIDRRGSEELETQIELDRPVSLSVQEQVGRRRVEVRALAMCCLAYLDQYEDALKGFDEPDFHSYWTSLFDALADALARGPASAGEVRISLEKLRGDDAALLYQLLWGCSPEQLETGKTERLVGYLDHPALDVRVLAIENLRRITGKDLLYRPEFTEARRRYTMQRWRRELDEGRITYAEPPAPLPGREPLERPPAAPEEVDESP